MREKILETRAFPSYTQQSVIKENSTEHIDTYRHFLNFYLNNSYNFSQNMSLMVFLTIS